MGPQTSVPSRVLSQECGALGSPPCPLSSFLDLSEHAKLRLREAGSTAPRGPPQCPRGRGGGERCTSACPHVQKAALLWARVRVNVSASAQCGCQGAISVCLVCQPFCLCHWPVWWPRWRCGRVNPFVSLSPGGGGLSSCRLQLGNPSKGE